MRRPKTKLGRAAVISMIFLSGMTFTALLGAEQAQAHQVSKRDCVRYALKKPGNHDYRQYKKCRRWARAHNNTHGIKLPWVLQAIRGCESGGGNPRRFNYKARNGSSSASGAFQYLDSTWGGHMGYKRAYLTPRRIQDKRALRDYRKNGTSPWEASRACWGHLI